MRLLVVAAEASGDALAAATLAALGPHWDAFGVGGSASVAAGLRAVVDADTLGLIGLVEVIGGIPRVLAAAARIVAEARRSRPDAVLLVDNPDLNLRLGPLLRRVLGPVPIIYLGAPQAWAWRPKRAQAMARWVDHLACLFPFEPPFFAAAGVRASFVGHPRAAAARAARAAHRGERDAIAICPGSRRAELARHLPVLRRAVPLLARRAHGRRLLLPVAPSVDAGALRDGLGDAADHVELVDDTLAALAESALAWVASGTVVTECVLMGTVPVVFYRLHPVTWAVAQRLVAVEHVAMANLLADERLVPELLQDRMTPHGLLGATVPLLDTDVRAPIAARLETLGRVLEADGDPARAVATIIEDAARH